MKKLQLYPDVTPVQGYERSMLYDLGRNQLHPVPNSLISFLELFDENQQFDETENEYIQFLLDSELAFFADQFDNEHIQQIDFQWKSPYIIQTLEVDILNEDFYTTLTEMQDSWNIPTIQLVFRSMKKAESLLTFVKSLKNSSIIHLNLIFLCKIENLKFLEDSCFQESFVKHIFIDKINEKTAPSLSSKKIHFITETEHFERFSKIENPFFCNITLFSENQHHHSYFNKRLYIGVNGEIKNGYESEQIFGAISKNSSTESLKNIVSNTSFTALWNVKKSDCDVCKDCELRSMCVDNRLPHKRSNNNWYHTTECNYNPYICKWKGEDGYQNLSKCGVISDENGFTIDHVKIATINAELWAEE